MLKLIIKLPQNCNADVFEETVQGMCYYRERHANSGFDGEYNGLIMTSAYMKDSNGERCLIHYEHEIDGDYIDDRVLGVLRDLQKLIPFEMYFEQRGQYDPELYSKPGYFDNSEPREPVKAIG